MATYRAEVAELKEYIRSRIDDEFPNTMLEMRGLIMEYGHASNAGHAHKITVLENWRTTDEPKIDQIGPLATRVTTLDTNTTAAITRLRTDIDDIPDVDATAWIAAAVATSGRNAAAIERLDGDGAAAIRAECDRWDALADDLDDTKGWSGHTPGSSGQVRWAAARDAALAVIGTPPGYTISGAYRAPHTTENHPVGTLGNDECRWTVIWTTTAGVERTSATRVCQLHGGIGTPETEWHDALAGWHDTDFDRCPEGRERTELAPGALLPTTGG